MQLKDGSISEKGPFFLNNKSQDKILEFPSEQLKRIEGGKRSFFKHTLSGD